MPKPPRKPKTEKRSLPSEGVSPPLPKPKQPAPNPPKPKPNKD